LDKFRIQQKSYLMLVAFTGLNKQTTLAMHLYITSP
jgi:hypothetical protein